MNSRHTRREQPRRAKFLAFETLESRDLLAAVAAPSGLIAWWTGDGNARDAMGGNNGILEGGASFATGKVGQAFSLDGVDDRVRIPNGAVLNPVQGLTIEAWVLLNSTNSNGQVIVSKWNDLTSDRSFIFKDQPICCKTGGGLFERTRIQLLGTNNIGIADETNLTNITVGQWTHVAVTYDTHTLKLFFNGAQDAAVDINPSQMLRVSTTDLLIGATAHGVAENFHGLIDEVSLYNRALVPSEIQAIYQADSDGKIKTSAMNMVGISPASGTIVDGTVTDFTVDFSFAYDVSSVQASDFVVNGRPADTFVATDTDTLTFHFNISPVTAIGVIGSPQTMTMAAGAITTNQSGVGKPSLTGWTATFQARLSSRTFTPQGTDIVPGSGSSNARDFRGTNAVAYFNAATSGGSRSVWKTDGTAAGTIKVNSNVSSPDVPEFEDMTYANGELFYIFMNGSHQLRRSNGSAGNTTPIASWADNTSLGSYFLGSAGSTVFFVNRQAQLGDQLWRTDGTPAGTVLLKDVNPDVRLTRYNDIWPNSGVVLDGKLYFIADDGPHGYQMWVSDGTSQGTKILTERYAGPFSDGWPGLVSTAYFFALNGFVYFRGHDSSGNIGLWKTDGTVNGTSQVKAGVASNSRLAPIASSQGKLYFSDSDGLWVTDGTANGVTRLKSLSVTSPLVQVGPISFFAADDGVHGNALWKTNGTPAGTVMVRAITGLSSAAIGWLTEVNGKLFFTADDALSGNELWESDGTEAGTMMAKDINPGLGSSSPSP